MAIPPCTRRSTYTIWFVAQSRKKPWKTLSNFRKRNIARSQPCSIKLRPSPIPSSTLRDRKASSATRLSLHRISNVSLGNIRQPGPRRFYRPCVFWQTVAAGFAAKNRPANSLAEPRHLVAGGASAHSFVPQRKIPLTRTSPRSAEVFDPGNLRSRCFKLSLLSLNSTDERRHRHHPAIHRACLGAGVHKFLGITKTDAVTDRKSVV